MKVRDIVRIEFKPHRFAVYQVVHVRLGGEDEESLYELIRLDVQCPTPINVPESFLKFVLDHQTLDADPNWMDIPTVTLAQAVIPDQEVPF